MPLSISSCDWYKNNKKGSTYQVEESIVSQRLQKEILNKDFAYSSGTVESEGKIDYMIINFLNTFKRHYAKIDLYKYNVTQKYETGNIKVWFVAEFSGGIEAFSETSEGTKITHPLLFKEVADQLQNFDKIDGIVFVDHNSAKAISRKMFAQQPFINKDKVRVLSANPHRISACFKISGSL